MSTVLFSTPAPTKAMKMKISSLKRMPTSFKLSTRTLKPKPSPIPNFSRKIPVQDMKPSIKVKDFEMSASCRSCGLEQTRKPDGKIVEGVQKPVEQVFAMVLSKEDCNYCRGEEGEMALFKQLQMAGKLKDVGKLSVPELGRRRRVRRERRVDDAVEKEHVKAEYVQKEVEKKESLIGWTIKRKSIMKNSIQIGSIKEESNEKNFVFEKDSVPRINPSDFGHAFVVAF